MYIYVLYMYLYIHTHVQIYVHVHVHAFIMHINTCTFTCTRDTVDKGLLGGRDAWSRTVVPVAVYTCTLYC